MINRKECSNDENIIKMEHEFSRNASSYLDNNIIQTKVINELVSKLDDKPTSLLDIGCGSGGIYKAVSWPLEKLVCIDISHGMIALHPKADHIEHLIRDFNSIDCFDDLYDNEFDRIVSASALHWATDLEKVFQDINDFATPVTFAIFTSGTFKTLHATASIKPLLRSSDEVIRMAKLSFDAEYTILHYRLTFSTTRDMFRYIKHSGVSGGRNVLNYQQMKELMNDYPLNYLEFEIVLIHENSNAF